MCVVDSARSGLREDVGASSETQDYVGGPRVGSPFPGPSFDY